MKRILIECHDLTLSTGTGIATYARGLAAAARDAGLRTLALHSVNRPVRAPGSVLNEIMAGEVGKPKRSILSPRRWRKNLRWLAGSPFGATPVAIATSGIVVGSEERYRSFDEVFVAEDLFIAAQRHLKLRKRSLELRFEQPPDLFHASRPVPIRLPGRPNLYTVHDLVPLRLPYTTLSDKPALHATMSELARTADHFVTVSDSAKNDLMEFFGVGADRITTTYQAVQFPPHLLEQSEEDTQTDLRGGFDLEPGEYFLFVGALEPKKNVRNLIEAYAGSGSRYPLVIAGAAGWLNEDEQRMIADERFLYYEIAGTRVTPKRRVRRLSYLPQARLVSLIRGARALLFPSIYEGFGLPVVEAMLLGTPVMTSNVSSLPEVAGDAALLVDPYDLRAMTKAIRTLDADADLRAELSRRGRVRAAFFSPERFRERMQSLYSRFL